MGLIMETLQKIISGNKKSTNKKQTNPFLMNQQLRIPEEAPPQLQKWPDNQNPTPYPFQNQQYYMNEQPVQDMNYENTQPTTHQPTNQTSEKTQEKKTEPIEKDYPEFLLFRINALKKYTEDNFSEVNEKISELESKLNEIKTEDIESLRESLMRLYEVIDKMNSALAEYIVNKINELTTPMNVEIGNLKSTINELAFTVQGLGVKLTTLTQIIENQSSKIESLELMVSKLNEENEFLKKKIKSIENIKTIGIDYIKPEIEFSYFIDSHQDLTPQVIVIEKESENKEEALPSDSGDKINIDELINVPEEVTDNLLNNYYSSLENTHSLESDTDQSSNQGEKIISMKMIQDESPIFTSEVTVDSGDDLNKIQLEEIVHEIKELKDKEFTVLTL